MFSHVVLYEDNAIVNVFLSFVILSFNFIIINIR